MFQIKVVDKIKIHISCSITFSENCAVYKIMQKNFVEPERPQMAMWRRFACWISKATRAQAHASAREPKSTCTSTHTHIYREICKTYCFSTAKIAF
jgi:hypothetical protein